jgi:hypothetical protein
MSFGAKSFGDSLAPYLYVRRERVADVRGFVRRAPRDAARLEEDASRRLLLSPAQHLLPSPR